jgi:hypothetical protein
MHLAISPEEMMARLEKRANFDDKKEAIQKRLAIYRTQTVPVLEKYCNKVVHVSTLSAPKILVHHPTVYRDHLVENTYTISRTYLYNSRHPSHGQLYTEH